MVLGSDFIYARCFHHQRLATTENFAIMKIQWICFSFDDILLERICLNMASRLKKEFGKNLKMFYQTFGMMDISIG